MNYVLKGSLYFSGAFIGGCIVSNTFAKKVDRNLISPVRNYRYTLENPNYWRTSEDMGSFTSEMCKGIMRMFKYENDI